MLHGCYADLGLVESSTGRHLIDTAGAARAQTLDRVPGMPSAVGNHESGPQPQQDEVGVRRPRLSRREQEVLVIWCQTENRLEAAKRLFIEPTTVASHVQRVRAKYEAVGRPATTKAALVARAIQDGILCVRGSEETPTNRDLFDAVDPARSQTSDRVPWMPKPVLNHEAFHRPLIVDKAAPRPRLSRRERQVMVMWCQTENRLEVAKRLFIEPTTVATHLQRVRAKYDAVGRPATTKAALVARAIQDGILSVDQL